MALVTENTSPPQEIQKNPRQGKRKKNDREINKRLRLEGKDYTTRKGKDVPVVPPVDFVTCTWKNKCTDSLTTETHKVMYEQFWDI